MTELRDAYYRGEPLVADAEYDAVEDELHAPVRHSRPMLSLEKATKPEQVEAFFERFPGQPVVVMPKLDGLSLAVVYEDRRLARAVTRGDGTTGDDVTPLVRALADGVPATVDAPGRVEVRGEAVMLRSTFAAYNAAHPDKPLINPRGAAAGTVRAKDPKTAAERTRRRGRAATLPAAPWRSSSPPRRRPPCSPTCCGTSARPARSRRWRR